MPQGGVRYLLDRDAIIFGLSMKAHGITTGSIVSVLLHKIFNTTFGTASRTHVRLASMRLVAIGAASLLHRLLRIKGHFVDLEASEM